MMDQALEVNIRSLLKELGLPSFELRAYLCLLKVRRQLSAPEISENATIPLTRVYSVMGQLEKLGFISIDRLNNPTRYCLKDPESSLRLMFKKHATELNGRVERLDSMLTSTLTNLKSMPNELPREVQWNVYHGDDVIYRSLIPSLVAGSKREVLMVGGNFPQTMTKEFLEEFKESLDRGVVWKTVVPPNADAVFKGLSGFFDKVFGLYKLAKITREHWGTRLFMMQNNLTTVTPFGLFDRSKVGFSILSPGGGNYLVTLVTDKKDVIDEFYALFQKVWESSAELEIPYIFAKVLQMR